MYKLKDIKAIHIEITENCNLSCLQCDRNENGGKVNPYLKYRELYIEDIKKSFSPTFISQLERMYICGNYGDPACAIDTLHIFKYFKECNPNIKLSMNTNGSVRFRKWWEALAQTTTVRFSIDGLKDTNYLYRRNSHWETIMANVTAFIDAGGYAIWDYLVFGHNEHQVEEARELSIKMGFKEFIIKKTGRFFSNIMLKGKEEYQGLTKPNEKYVNKSLSKEEEIKNKYGSMSNYLDKTIINCKVLRNKEIYLSAEGIILPCCWLAGSMYKWYLPPKSTQIWKLIDTKLNIKNNTLHQIFESGIFNKIQKTWDEPTISDGKLKICALKCGTDFDPFGDQFK